MFTRRFFCLKSNIKSYILIVNQRNFLVNDNLKVNNNFLVNDNLKVNDNFKKINSKNDLIDFIKSKNNCDFYINYNLFEDLNKSKNIDKDKMSNIISNH